MWTGFRQGANYSLNQIVQSIGPVESLDSLATALKKAIPQPLIAALTDARKSPESFKQRIPSAMALGVTSIGVENDQPAFVDLTFSMEDRNVNPIVIRIAERRCPGTECNEGCSKFVPRDLAEQFSDDHPDYWQGDVDRVVKNAKQFVQLAIDTGFDKYGSPISALVITPTGSEWHNDEPVPK